MELRRGLVTAASFSLALASATFAQAPHRTIAASGLRAPDGSTYGTSFHLNFFVNETPRGRVLFSTTTGSGEGSIIAGTPASLRIVSKSGTTAADLGTIRFDYTNVDAHEDGTGGVLFHASLADRGPTHDEVIIREHSGRIGAVAVEGMEALGTAAGVVFASAYDPNDGGYEPALTLLAATDAGEAVIFGRLAGPGVDESNDTGIWYGTTPSDLDLLLREGTPIPTLPDTDSLIGGDFATSKSNHIAISAALRAPDAEFQRADAILVGSLREGGGSIRKIVRNGDPAPALPGLRFVESSGWVVLNDAGDVTFAGFAVAEGTQSPTKAVLWTVREDETRVVAAQGEVAPGSDASFTQFYGVQSNARGGIAFLSPLKADGQEGASGTGLFVYDRSAIRAVAIEGQAVPGAPEGSEFASVGYGYLNDAGQLAFTAAIDDPGDPAPPVDVLWLADPDGGALTALLRNGDPLEVAPGDVRTVHAFAIDQVLHDGNVVFWAQFADGTAGLFTTAIPEPRSVALAAIISSALSRRRPRRR